MDKQYVITDDPVFEDLFNGFKHIAYEVSNLGNIIQNSGVTITDKDIVDFVRRKNEAIIKIMNITTDVLTAIIANNKG